jgi:serine protease Do
MMFRKKTGLLCIVVCIDLAALGIVAYGQTTKPKAHSATLQGAAAGYLGAGVEGLTDERAKALNLKDNSGVEVKTVTEDAPASKAGIKVRDVILEINGQKVDSGEEFMNLIIGKTPGTKVSLTVVRNGVRQAMAATLGSRPPDLPINASTPQGFMIPAVPFPMTPDDFRDMIGGDVPKALFAGEGLGPQLAAYFGVHEGVLVQMVYEKTSAERAGLKAGDVVTKVNGMPVASLREISGAVRQTNKKAVIFTVVREKKEITLTIEIAWNRDPNDRDAIN